MRVSALPSRSLGVLVLRVMQVVKYGDSIQLRLCTPARKYLSVVPNVGEREQEDRVGFAEEPSDAARYEVLYSAFSLAELVPWSRAIRG